MAKKITPFLIGILVLNFAIAISQIPTIGLIQHDPGSFDDGYVLFTPMPSRKTCLIDKCGKEIHSWTSTYRPGLSVYLMPDGNLLRTGWVQDSLFTSGGSGGMIEKLDWNSNVLWNYKISDGSTQCQHHDVMPLPNGNVLAIVWELKTRAEAIAAGRDTALLGTSVWSDKIVELQPVGTDSAIIVWEWHIWDHLVQDYDSTKPNFLSISANPQLININYRAGTYPDWVHCNGLDYNPVFDQVMITNHNFGEIWIIDHSTTTAEAASHNGGRYNKGGDILYRWGNPPAYNLGSITDIKLDGPHNGHWIKDGAPDAGKIMIFNNMVPYTSFNYSSVEIISPPVDSFGNYSSQLPYLPSASFWTYADTIPGNFYASNVSSAQQLPNGNVLICDGPHGKFFEVDSMKNKVWEYINPMKANGPNTQGNLPGPNSVFRCGFYPKDFSGFASHTLIPGQPIELNPYAYNCTLNVVSVNEPEEEEIDNRLAVYPNPVSDMLHIVLNEKAAFKIELIDLLGQTILTADELAIDVSAIPDGLYLLKVIFKDKEITQKIIKN